ncbi:hypothetical protein ACWC5I_45475 [Kitasatospora sp. NPDC001574]
MVNARKRPIRVAGTGHSGIQGVGGYRPRRRVDNAELCRSIDSTPEWIETRSGIRRRGFAGPDETLPVMAVAAARQALDRAGARPADLDLVLVASRPTRSAGCSLSTTPNWCATCCAG